MQKLTPKRGTVETVSVEDATRILAEARSEIARMRTAIAAFSRALAGETEHWSTQGGDRHAPPEYQGRAKKWRTDAPKIPGAVRVGRWVTVSRAAYAAWLESQASTPALPAKPSVAKAWSPEDALVGLRAVSSK